jgi:hypothetical protein
VEVLLAVDPTTSVRLQRGRSGLALDIDVEQRRVVLTRPPVDPARSSWATEGAVAGTGPVDLRLVLDGSVVEAYVAGGPVFTERVYPSGDDPWMLSVRSEGAGSCLVTVTRLGTAVEH